jgi:hypothetical protein
MTINRRSVLSLIVAVVAATMAACMSSGPNVKRDSKFLSDNAPPIGDSVVTFFALGDWGKVGSINGMVAEALERKIDNLVPLRSYPPFVVGLGDNVYENGLKSGWSNPQTDDLLRSTFGEPYADLDWEGEPLQFYVVPGNHDYAAGMGTGSRDSGYGDVIHQETTAEGAFEGFNYYPLDYPGKPDTNDEEEYLHIRERAEALGQLHPLPEYMTRPQAIDFPVGIPIAMIAIDTQALIERQSAPGDMSNDPSWRVLDSLLARSDRPWKFVLGHHPIQTYSGHGSYRTIDNWLWTGARGKVAANGNGLRMTLLTSGAFIGALIHPAGWVAAGVALALPAISVVADNIHKHPQDNDHWAYRTVADSLEDILARHDAIYLAGHDHNLQLIEVSGRMIQVVSGSSSKTSWVASSAPGMHYSASKPGFVRLDATHRTLWMQFCTVEESADTTECGTTFRMDSSG